LAQLTAGVRFVQGLKWQDLKEKAKLRTSMFLSIAMPAGAAHVKKWINSVF
jgi:hypothetical protein